MTRVLFSSEFINTVIHSSSFPLTPPLCLNIWQSVVAIHSGLLMLAISSCITIKLAHMYVQMIVFHCTTWHNNDLMCCTSGLVILYRFFLVILNAPFPLDIDLDSFQEYLYRHHYKVCITKNSCLITPPITLSSYTTLGYVNNYETNRYP